MIRSVELTNFQKHAKRLVEFDPQLTVLVGDNAAGKSTILRAIRWVVTNRPSIKEVVRWGNKVVKVTLRLSDHVVYREAGKTAGDSGYKVGDGELYRAVGAGIPEAVSNALAMSEVNFQGQIDRPFWLSDSAPEVARTMNRVVDLDIIDTSLAHAEGECRRADAAVAGLESVLNGAEAEAGSLRWLAGAEAMLAEAKAHEAEADEHARRESGLAVLIGKIEEAEEVIPSPPDLTALSKHVELFRRHAASERELRQMVVDIEKGEAELCEINASISRNRKELSEATPETCPTCGQVVPS